MDAAVPETINNFQLVHHLPYDHGAGGVRVYKRNDFTNTTISVQIELSASHQIKLSAMIHFGDIIVTNQCNFPDESKLIQATIDEHQRIRIQRFGDIFYWLTVTIERGYRLFDVGWQNDFVIGDSTFEFSHLSNKCIMIHIPTQIYNHLYVKTFSGISSTTISFFIL